VLAALPVTWRFYAKHRIFRRIDAMDPSDPDRTDGAAVLREHDAILAQFPDLARAPA
jgi:hypothetical protein